MIENSVAELLLLLVKLETLLRVYVLHAEYANALKICDSVLQLIDHPFGSW